MSGAVVVVVEVEVVEVEVVEVEVLVEVEVAAAVVVEPATVVEVNEVGSGPVVTEIDGTVDVDAGPTVVLDPPVVVEVTSVCAGNESSDCSSPPPVKITRATMPRTTATAPAARAMSAPGWFHQPPGGGSYSGSYSEPGPYPGPPIPPPPPGGGGGMICVGSDGPPGPWSLTSAHLSRGSRAAGLGARRRRRSRPGCRTRRWLD